jgi:hypothetical protein
VDLFFNKKEGTNMELIKLLKRPNILQRISDFQSVQTQTEQSLREVYRNRYMSPGKPLPAQITSVIIDHHTVKRWNERVGPIMERDELEKLFNDLIRIPYRITTLSDEIAILDDEIVFIYKFEDNKLVILTIYGRISLKPSLQGLSELKRFNHQQSDRLNLSLPHDVLEQQFAPPVPDDVYFFKGRHTTYRLEHYKSRGERNELIFLTTFSANGIQRMREIKLDAPEQAKLNSKVLYVLYCLGYCDFVYQHIKFHNPDKIEKLEQKNKEKEKELKSKVPEEMQNSEEVLLREAPVQPFPDDDMHEKEKERLIVAKHREAAKKQEEIEFEFLLKVFGTPV